MVGVKLIVGVELAVWVDVDVSETEEDVDAEVELVGEGPGLLDGLGWARRVWDKLARRGYPS